MDNQNITECASKNIIKKARIQELSFPSPGDLPNPGIESTSLASPAFGRWVLYQLARTSLSGTL